ncbi:hypothetical protein HQO90_24925 [Rhodococcus fascians]|nr:hypothetical protein [Rhodococcus fascians]
MDGYAHLGENLPGDSDSLGAPAVRMSADAGVAARGLRLRRHSGVDRKISDELATYRYWETAAARSQRQIREKPRKFW